jgi:site-specific recombinase XerD
MTDTLATTRRAELARGDILNAFAAFLRLNVAQGDASPQTVRSYHAHVGQYVAWCDEEGLDPAGAHEEDLEAYRRRLVEADYARGTIGVKLSVVHRLYQAAVWRGLRADSSAEGLPVPRQATHAKDHYNAKVGILSADPSSWFARRIQLAGRGMEP